METHNTLLYLIDRN